MPVNTPTVLESFVYKISCGFGLYIDICAHMTCWFNMARLPHLISTGKGEYLAPLEMSWTVEFFRNPFLSPLRRSSLTESETHFSQPPKVSLQALGTSPPSPDLRAHTQRLLGVSWPKAFLEKAGRAALTPSQSLSSHCSWLLQNQCQVTSPGLSSLTECLFHTLHGISCRVSSVLKEFSRTEFLNVLLQEYCTGRSDLMGLIPLQCPLTHFCKVSSFQA